MPSKNNCENTKIAIIVNSPPPKTNYEIAILVKLLRQTVK